MTYAVLIVVCVALGYFVAPRVVGVARHEYDAAVKALCAEIERLKAEIALLKAKL